MLYVYWMPLFIVQWNRYVAQNNIFDSLRYIYIRLTTSWIYQLPIYYVHSYLIRSSTAYDCCDLQIYPKVCICVAMPAISHQQQQQLNNIPKVYRRDTTWRLCFHSVHLSFHIIIIKINHWLLSIDACPFPLCHCHCRCCCLSNSLGSIILIFIHTNWCMQSFSYSLSLSPCKPQPKWFEINVQCFTHFTQAASHGKGGGCASTQHMESWRNSRGGER